MSKGSKSRPLSVDIKTYETNWDRIFLKKQEYSEREESGRYRITSSGQSEIYREGYWQPSWEITNGGH